MRARLPALAACAACAAFAAGAAAPGALTPRPAAAQGVVGSYGAQGCARGVVRDDGSGGAATPVVGDVLCVSGPVQLERRRVGGGAADQFRFTGALAPTFGAEFAGSGVGVDAAAFGFTGARADGSTQTFSAGLGAFLTTPAVTVGQPGASAFVTGVAPVSPATVFASARDARGTFALVSALPGQPGGGSVRADLSLTRRRSPSRPRARSARRGSSRSAPSRAVARRRAPRAPHGVGRRRAAAGARDA
jgi:hypothetical protein